MFLVPPPIFVSSCFEDPIGQRLPIRDVILSGLDDELQRRPVGYGHLIWMAENQSELDPNSSSLSQMKKAQLCLEGVRSAECFVAIITSRHGSRVNVEGAGIVPSSFFEAELFEAAVLRKPSFIFLLKGYEPDAKMASLLKLLAPFFPNMALQPMSVHEILREIDKLIAIYQRPQWLRRRFVPPHLRSTVDLLFHERHQAYDIRDLPSIRFLGGVFDRSLQPPDPSVVEAVLNKASAAESYSERLTLTWFAFRALMGAPYTDSKFRHMHTLWVRVFESWART
jgi:Domain of unknown function (DUF4062)